MTIPGLIAPGALAPAAVAPVGLRVIGLDLSITSTGVCRPNGTTFAIKTRAKEGPRRLIHIRSVIEAELAEHRPDLAVIEDLPTKMHASALKSIGCLHGVVQCALLDAGVPWVYVAPATLKKYAADHGNADKRRMADAAYLADGAEFPGDLNARGEGGDQCDAWWLRAAGHDALGAPLFSMPQAQRDRLTKVTWPADLLQNSPKGQTS